MEYEIFHKEFKDLIGDGKLRKIATGFQFLEGPLWDASHSRLLFSDIPANKIYQLKHERVTTFRSPSDMSNGLTFNRNHQLLACCHATSQVVMIDFNNFQETLVSHFEGQELNSPNDIVVKSDDSVYFTDPNYGRINNDHGILRKKQLPFQGVYRFSQKEGLILLANDIDAPNGLCFSCKEEKLYVNDSSNGQIFVFDVNAEGHLSNKNLFFHMTYDPSQGVPDGMKLDELGNLYCTGPGGIWVFQSNGTPLGIIKIPEIAANLNWGGDCWNHLYITATSSIYHIEMNVRGNQVQL